MEGLQRRLAVARGDEPADLVVRGGRVLSVFTREWLEADVAVADGVDRRCRQLRGSRVARRGGKLRRPRLHRRAHAPRVGEAHGGRVRAPRAPARDDGRRRRSARDRERPRRRRRALAARRELGTSARRLLHGAVVRSRLAVRVAAPGADARRSRVAHAAPSGARARGDDELPRRRRWLARRAREARARRREPRRRARTRFARTRPPGVRGGRHLLRSRGAHGRGRSRAPASRYVAPRTRSVDGAESASAAAAGRGVRAVDASPSARTIATPRTSPTRGTSTGWCARRSPPASPPRTRSLMASHHPALWHGLSRHGAIAPGYVADLLLLPGPRELPAVDPC